MRFMTLTAFCVVVAYMLMKCQPKTHEEQAFYAALDNFVYMEEPNGLDRHYRYATHKRKFIGDCEDFAFTLQSAIGGVVWIVEHDSVSHHAVLVVNDTVYDNFYKMPMNKKDYPTKFVSPLSFRGQVIDNEV